MNHVLRRALCALAVIGALVLSTATAANAASTLTVSPAAAARPAAAPGSTLAPASDFSALALTCPAGNLCVWPVTDGSSGRCTWLNADNDWRNTPVVCSWSSSKPVKAIVNNGTSSTYWGVCLYAGANYTNFRVGYAQGWGETSSTGWMLRSHRWVRSYTEC